MKYSCFSSSKKMQTLNKDYSCNGNFVSTIYRFLALLQHRCNSKKKSQDFLEDKSYKCVHNWGFIKTSKRSFRATCLSVSEVKGDNMKWYGSIAKKDY